MSEVENRTVRKIMLRLIPFLIACYFVAFIDRTNISFAKLQMNSALGLSETAYGFGAVRLNDVPEHLVLLPS